MFQSIIQSKVGLAYTQNLGESISSLDTSVDYYAAGSLDETVFLWKTPVKKETESVRLEGHSLGVVDVKFNKHLLAVSSLDSVLRVWDLDKNILRKEIVCEKMDNWKICWYQDLLCTAGEGGRVSIFDLEGQQEFEPFSVENSYATCVASDNKCIAICTDSGSLHIVDNFLAKYKLHSLQRLHKKIVRSVQFSQQGLRTLTSSDDGDIKLVDLQKMVPIRTFSGHQGSVNSIDFNPIDDNLFVSCSFDYTVRLWDTVSGQCIEQFQPFDKRDDRLWSMDK
ncbi:hypothetical protein pb186bvf_008173 [Paramecium bursaria]